ncbi:MULTISPECIES: Ldh family oxidoreductase [Flectobacillus]|jgi:LDH2 family malate/lactate/ureidoglycolate dehydrogenase|uniref:Ldh family oxidoreductase n=1 Tax=Flectobacillus TaxID=101 RepID=UPI000BA42531|nr:MULTISPECIES: Ldh family oxidoreductase [Flectobacillus]MDI9869600.1 Ldh family oxidoreductase [Flectobacillus roseus]NBA76992.1 Ldh family oxidoreductase [Emticicia sp. ODNR4P]PAC31232.1 malate dehydrogenase [Flectobacillus sp. BAB-3569]
MNFQYTQLQEFIQQVFLSIGCSEEDALLASQVLISADLRGVDSHGIARLSGYVRLYDNGRLNPKPIIKIIHETPSTAVIDGDKGLGLVVAPKAMEIAMEKADKVGSGWISVQNSNHFGIAGYHAMKALHKDMIGWAMTNAAPLVTPTFSKEKLLGTNPIAVAVPAAENPPFVADFATTAVAYGKMEILQRKGAPAPLGWVQDKDGNPTDDANAVKNGGALLPLGGDREHGSHKGYGLGAIVDIFSGVLSGANFGPWVPPFATAGFMSAGEQVGKGTGHFLGAMRIDGFRPADEFKADMDKWINRFKAAPAVDGKNVIIPGDPERELEAERKANGINLLEPVVNDLNALATRFGIKF